MFFTVDPFKTTSFHVREHVRPLLGRLAASVCSAAVVPQWHCHGPATARGVQTPRNPVEQVQCCGVPERRSVAPPACFDVGHKQFSSQEFCQGLHADDGKDCAHRRCLFRQVHESKAELLARCFGAVLGKRWWHHACMHACVREGAGCLPRSLTSHRFFSTVASATGQARGRASSTAGCFCFCTVSTVFRVCRSDPVRPTGVLGVTKRLPLLCRRGLKQLDAFVPSTVSADDARALANDRENRMAFLRPHAGSADDLHGAPATAPRCGRMTWEQVQRTHRHQCISLRLEFWASCARVAGLCGARRKPTGNAPFFFAAPSQRRESNELPTHESNAPPGVHTAQEPGANPLGRCHACVRPGPKTETPLSLI